MTTEQAASESDSENDECRDVYAFFGLAMFYAQVIEEALGALIAISQYPLTKAQANQIMDRLDACTLGTLLRELRKHLLFEASLETTFQRALERRNYLAHRFFRDHAVDFMTGAGRRRMLDELTDATECFQELNAHMLAITLVVGRPIGISQEFIDRSIVEMLEAGDSEDREG